MSNDNHDTPFDTSSRSSFCRYTNRNRDSYGQSAYEYGITCRNILTDPEIHSQLKQNHADNPYYRHQGCNSKDILPKPVPNRNNVGSFETCLNLVFPSTKLVPNLSPNPTLNVC